VPPSAAAGDVELEGQLAGGRRMLQTPTIPNLTTCLRSLTAARGCLTSLRSTVLSLTSSNNKVGCRLSQLFGHGRCVIAQDTVASRAPRFPVCLDDLARVALAAPLRRLALQALCH
jgi:hypothetical protein